MKKYEKYVKLTADAIPDDYDKVKIQMETAKEKYGITYKEYYENRIFELTETQIIKKAKVLRLKKEKKDKLFSEVTEATGMTKKEILEDIRAINQKGIFKIVIAQYAKFELYNMNIEEKETFLKKLLERNTLKEELKCLFLEVDEGKKVYNDIESKIEKFYQVVRETLTDKYKKELVYPYRPDLVKSEAELLRIATDIEVSKLLLGFSVSEYYTFRFWEKDISEKRSFLTNKERIRVLNNLNNVESQDILKDKAKCYQILNKYFQRQQVVIEKIEDYEMLKRFCYRKKVFVKKPFAESFGKGIEPVYVGKNTDYKKLTEKLLSECGKFVAEELIVSHWRMKRLNPGSVNTVRIETFFDGEKVEFISAFMRIGKEGSFVDNGGAGGIGVSIDVHTGIVTSDGCDEMGRSYEKHPTSGICFKGYRIPNWKKALKLGEEIADKVPGASYIGWDLAYTNKRKWVIVEGNGVPQFIFNQGTIGKGLKKEFMEKFDR